MNELRWCLFSAGHCEFCLPAGPLLCSLETNANISLQPSKCPQWLQPLSPFICQSVWTDVAFTASMIGFPFYWQEATMFNTDGFFVTELGRLTTEHVKSILRISSISACADPSVKPYHLFSREFLARAGHEPLLGPVPSYSVCLSGVPFHLQKDVLVRCLIQFIPTHQDSRLRNSVVFNCKL